jgi:glycosyltransferase involved in cell wall biosynthesis
MKILQVSFSLDNGGAEKFIVELSNEISKEHEVTLCTFKEIDNEMIPPKYLSSSVKFVSLHANNKWHLKNTVKISRILKKTKPEVVHIHSSIVLLNFLLLIPRFRKIIFIHTIHCNLTKGYSKFFNLVDPLFYLYPRLHHVCISKKIFEEFKKKYKKTSFFQIDNGIVPLLKTDDFAQTDIQLKKLIPIKPSRTLIAIGNYSDNKRFDMLMDIMAQFEPCVKDVVLLLLGEDDTEKKRNFQKVLEKKPANVQILGLKANIADYLILSDALILSSSMEGMPLVILEAMSLGKPIIASPAGGVADMIINRENGFLAEDLTEEALKAAVLNYLNASDSELHRISENNRKKFNEQYNIEKCAIDYYKLYNQITKHAKLA